MDDPQLDAWPMWEDEEPKAPRRRRWPVLLAVSVIPWIAVAVLWGRQGMPDEVDAPVAQSDAPTAASPAPTLTPTPTPTSVATSPPTPSAMPERSPGASSSGTVVSSGGRLLPAAGEAAALATVAVRDWLGGVGPKLQPDAASGSDTYVDHVVVEAVDHPAPGAVVVSVLAIVLHPAGDTYGRAELRRVAVPLRLDAAGARLAGQPWPLPAPALSLAPLPGTTVEDPDLLVEAGAALESAGFGDVEILAMERTDGWPVIVRARAVPPGAKEPAEHVVWLRPHLGGLVVAGTTPPKETP